MKSKIANNPRAKLTESLKDLLGCTWIDELESDIPSKWEKHGDLILFKSNCFQRNEFLSLESKLWEAVCEALQCQRIAFKTKIEDDDFRSPKVKLVYGTNTWVKKKENGIVYLWDISRSMFCVGNITEKQRVGSFDCKGETVVDMFAGIGYFVLSYLIHAKASLVHACEWNPASIEALKRNLKENKVGDRCIIHEGDCREVSPVNVADRVNLGLLPSSEVAYQAACRALKTETGGVLHIHSNVETKDSSSDWTDWKVKTMHDIRIILEDIHKAAWDVDAVHVERVKSYAPHVYHLVLDLSCRPRQQ